MVATWIERIDSPCSRRILSRFVWKVGDLDFSSVIGASNDRPIYPDLSLAPLAKREEERARNQFVKFSG